MIKSKSAWIFWLGIVLVFGTGGVFYYFLLNPPRGEAHFTVMITEVSLCDGWDEAGNLIKLPKILSPEETAISVCGHLRVNNPPVAMQIYWYHEGKSIFTDQLFKPEADYYFISTLRPEGAKFQEGSYQITFTIGRAKMWETEFQVQ